MLELDPRWHADDGAVSLDDELLLALPRQLRDTLRAVEDEQEPQLALQELCLTLVPMTFQLLALELSGEYLHSRDEPDAATADSLAAMVRRPGPGKWVGFIRVAVGYFRDRQTAVIPAEGVAAIAASLVAKDRPRVRLSHGGAEPRRMDLWEALINVRNRFAHSRRIRRELAAELVADHLRIWKALIGLLAPIFEARMLVADGEGEGYRSLDGRPVDPARITHEATARPLILWNPETGALLELLPLVISLGEPGDEAANALLLEEVKGKHVLYLHRDRLIKRKHEYRQLMQMVQERTPQVESLDSSQLSVGVLGERIDRVTTRTLRGFEDALKYVPALFVERESLRATLDGWLDSELSGCILAGDPGVGKTSLVAHWVEQRRRDGDHVLLLEAARLEDPDLPRALEAMLGLRSSLKECLESVVGEAKEQARRFIVVIDGVNEFVGSSLEGRGVLWREINSLVERFDDLRPWVKLLVTTRSDLWQRDFPRVEAADRVLKRRLFFGESDGEFPRVALGRLDLAEAQSIYSKAQREVPGMAPETPWAELPPSVKELTCNPFLLRLILQTYSGTEVPKVSERRLTRKFARERALAQQAQRDLLFRLLERMTELRKTEISLDELLFAGTKEGEASGRSLQEIVFDPRPLSPYRQLIDQGIIEEHLVGEGEEAEERLTFAQEKVTDLMYSELTRRKMKRFAAIAAGIVVVLAVTLPLMMWLMGEQHDSRMANSRRALAESSLPVSTVDALQARVEELLETYRIRQRVFALGLSLFACVILLAFIANYNFAQARASQRFVMDLPSRFQKEKLRDLQEKYLFATSIPGAACWVVPIVAVFQMTDESRVSELVEAMTVPTLVGVALLLLGEIAAAVLVLLRHTDDPGAVRALLGFDALKHDLFIGLYALPSIVLLTVLVPFIPYGVNVGDHSEIVRLDDALRESVELQSLRESAVSNEHDQRALGVLEQLGRDFDEARLEAKDLRDLLFGVGKVFLPALLIFLPLSIALKVALARPLEGLVMRRSWSSARPGA